MAAFSKLSGAITPKYSAVAAIGIGTLLYAVHHSAKRKTQGKGDVKIFLNEKGEKKEKAAVDALFFARMSKIMKILIPGFFNTEMAYILLVAIALAARTVCDVWMIQNGTFIESAIIGRNVGLFKKYLWNYIYAMPLLVVAISPSPVLSGAGGYRESEIVVVNMSFITDFLAILDVYRTQRGVYTHQYTVGAKISIVNNTMKYGLSELKLRFRTRLSNHLYMKYLSGFTYYKMSNLDNRISNADQLLTQDVERFCNSVGDLYSNLSKPVLDIILYSVKLAGAIGVQGPSWMIGYLVISGLFLTRLRRPIGRMTVTEQRLEGDYRYVNSRLITNSEEVAFYQGNQKEKHIILTTFYKLVAHLRSFIFFRFNMGLVDNMIAKYCATVVGYLVVSRPFLNPMSTRHMNSTASELLEDYYQSGRMLVRMAEAIGRVVLAGREMTRLAGFTARVTQFMKVLNDLNNGKYERTMVNNEREQTGKKTDHKPGSGKIITRDHVIKFEHVPLVTPNGDVLVDELNFEVTSGKNVLVCGPNGCGKSSLFRILGELWPLFGGTVTKPDAKELFYIPQRPYMTLGTLRDQVIYPHNKEVMLKRGYTDTNLLQILEEVQLSYILEREGGWDATQDWMDVLSGGEKQRIAMARLFYNKPQFAILDECTSAVSVDVEGFMYQHCREVGITLFTVSHRKSLWKHHEYYLSMDGRGSFEFKPITAETVEFGS